MLGETEPQRRFAYVTVCMEHYILLFGGAWWDDRKGLEQLSANIIWMYNLYTEQWKKYTIPAKERGPHAINKEHAEVIECLVEAKINLP